MRRAAAILTLLAALAAAPGAAAEWSGWEQPIGPGGQRTLLGEVGDVECWEANRCLLITGGNGGMPAGLYAYDGAGWYLYSTVCGGSEGRIAWAGPSEFWTISDQQRGQQTGAAPAQQVSLCHFRGGEVVASYAQPVGQLDSYLPMNAAACRGPDECWFGGERLDGTVNVGAFHLYWNGFSITPVPSLVETQPELEDPGRSVVGLAYHEGDLFEGVRAQAGDEAQDEPLDQPTLLHRIVPGIVPEFLPELPASPISFGGEEAVAEQLQGFHLSSDGDGLWAASGALAAPAEVTVLRRAGASFEQLSLEDAFGAFLPGDRISGLAAEPGAAAAWVTYSHASGEGGEPPARLARILADGTVEAPLALPVASEGLSRKGRAGPIDCAEAGQCWMATEGGWLFHLGPDPANQGDPAMHALVTFRPPDASLPSVPPIALPEDDSGAYLALEVPLTSEAEEGRMRRRPPLYSKLKTRLVGDRVLLLSFTLRQKARVQLLARRRGEVVARTPRRVLAKGRHTLRVRLDPERWPTAIKLQAKAVKGGGR